MAKLKPCKTCGKKVSINADVCPNCGEKNPTKIISDSAAGFLIIVFLIIGYVWWSSPNEESEDESSVEIVNNASNSADIDLPLESARDYEIISVTDASFLGRKRLSVHVIANDVETFKSRAQTVIKAAYEIAAGTSSDIISVQLGINRSVYGSFSLARAEISIDGKNWTGDDDFAEKGYTAEAYKGQLDPLHVRIATLWEENRNSFLTKDDGFGGKVADEDKLAEFIGKELGMAGSDVKDAMYFFIMSFIGKLEPYTPQ